MDKSDDSKGYIAVTGTVIAFIAVIVGVLAWLLPFGPVGPSPFARQQNLTTIAPLPSNMPTPLAKALTQAPTLTATPQLTLTRTPAPTATPQSTLTPDCPAVSGPFAAVWRTIQNTVGCASGSVISGLMVEENFQDGKMFWRELLDYAQVLVLFNDGTWQIVKHSPFVEGSPDFSCPDANTPSRCPPTPKRGFGMVWCDTPVVRSRLGNATDCERDYQGLMQQFERGFMLRSDSGAIYVFYNNRRWERK